LGAKIMGLLKHFRSSNKLKEDRNHNHSNGFSDSKGYGQNGHQNGYQNGYLNSTNGIVSPGNDYISRCPPKVIRRIFEFVCPHTIDRNYDACEDADIAEDSCPLCDLRDLSHCAQTRRDWYQTAQTLL
jgi:hypothetical protein